MTTDENADGNVSVKTIQFWVEEDGYPVAGFVHDGCLIADATKSMDGQYGVDPEEAYGIPTQQVAELAVMNGLIRGGAKMYGPSMAAMFSKQLGMMVPEAGTKGAEEFENEFAYEDPALARAMARVMITTLIMNGRSVQFDGELKK